MPPVREIHGKLRSSSSSDSSVRNLVVRECGPMSPHQSTLLIPTSSTTERRRRNGEDEGSGGRRPRSGFRVLSDFRLFSVNNLVILLLVFINLLSMRCNNAFVEATPSSDDKNDEKLDSKIRMFLELHCSTQNETLEQYEFESFMSCGPSHGAGIVKRLRSLPEFQSEDIEDKSRASRKVILEECKMWPEDGKCQQTTFRLIEKCFEEDQKFIFYFNYALTDVICQSARDMFIRFWLHGGDQCLVSHLRSLKKDFSDCLELTNTTSDADVSKNFDEVMQCFRSRFDKDCEGIEANEVIYEITAEIKRVYRETSSRNGGVTTTVASLPIVFISLLTINLGWRWMWMMMW